ncbi:jg1647 [Pararge aegeria aegeria]|uniref:Jg1647 protein n=1 Tax=Pararge aegeria aegeria TaxID=348720 RepID=A0A8S4RF52_9NEOP|nr:jg1647 [Pararge aegeria aegeria]
MTWRPAITYYRSQDGYSHAGNDAIEKCACNTLCGRGSLKERGVEEEGVQKFIGSLDAKGEYESSVFAAETEGEGTNSNQGNRDWMYEIVMFRIENL